MGPKHQLHYCNHSLNIFFEVFMNIFSAIGDFIIKLFSLIGAIILGIPKIPEKLRGADTKGIRKKIDTEDIKENLKKFKESTKSTATNITEKKK